MELSSLDKRIITHAKAKLVSELGTKWKDKSLVDIEDIVSQAVIDYANSNNYELADLDKYYKAILADINRLQESETIDTHKDVIISDFKKFLDRINIDETEVNEDIINEFASELFMTIEDEDDMDYVDEVDRVLRDYYKDEIITNAPDDFNLEEDNKMKEKEEGLFQASDEVYKDSKERGLYSENDKVEETPNVAEDITTICDSCGAAISNEDAFIVDRDDPYSTVLCPECAEEYELVNENCKLTEEDVFDEYEDTFDKLLVLRDKEYSPEMLNIELNKIAETENQNYIDANYIYDEVRDNFEEIDKEDIDEYDYTIEDIDANIDRVYAMDERKVLSRPIKIKGDKYNLLFTIKDYYNCIIYLYDVEPY